LFDFDLNLITINAAKLEGKNCLFAGNISLIKILIFIKIIKNGNLLHLFGTST